MNVNGEKIKGLISYYGIKKEYPEKSYVVRFCDDFDLNYKQWNAYCSGTQNLGLKIIEVLMDIFPNLNLNWLLKDDNNMFCGEEIQNKAAEPPSNYSNEVSNRMLMEKLESIEKEIKKGFSK